MTCYRLMAGVYDPLRLQVCLHNLPPPPAIRCTPRRVEKACKTFSLFFFPHRYIMWVTGWGHVSQLLPQWNDTFCPGSLGIVLPGFCISCLMWFIAWETSSSAHWGGARSPCKNVSQHNLAGPQITLWSRLGFCVHCKRKIKNFFLNKRRGTYISESHSTVYLNDVVLYCIFKIKGSLHFSIHFLSIHLLCSFSIFLSYFCPHLISQHGEAPNLPHISVKTCWNIHFPKLCNSDPFVSNSPINLQTSQHSSKDDLQARADANYI